MIKTSNDVAEENIFNFSRKHNYLQELFTYSDLLVAIKTFENRHPDERYNISVYIRLEDEEEYQFVAGVYIYTSPEEDEDNIFDHSHQVFDIVKDLIIQGKVKKDDIALIFDEEGKAYNIIRMEDTESKSITFWKDEYEYNGVRERFIHGDNEIIMKLICKPADYKEDK